MNMKDKYEEILNFVEGKISPYTFNEKGKSTLHKLINDYDYDLILECIEISFSHYIRFDENNNIIQASIENFLSKIGGIAYNKNLSPLQAKVRHILNIVKSEFSYFNQNSAQALLNRYIKALKSRNYTDEQIVVDLENDLVNMIHECKHWSEWKARMEKWEKDVYDWGEEDKQEEIIYTDCILPTVLFKDTPSYILKICCQINSSYDNGLYDCTAVMMRRLIEVLLVLTYQYLDIEKDILNDDGKFHIVLDKIIKKAQQNKKINLSSNTKKDMETYKKLGNFSAHKIWYNCTEPDIKNNILAFRALVEELLYKSGVNK